jgi:hypothetical protein
MVNEHNISTCVLILVGNMSTVVKSDIFSSLRVQTQFQKRKHNFVGECFVDRGLWKMKGDSILTW